MVGKYFNITRSVYGNKIVQLYSHGLLKLDIEENEELEVFKFSATPCFTIIQDFYSVVDKLRFQIKIDETGTVYIIAIDKLFAMCDIGFNIFYLTT